MRYNDFIYWHIKCVALHKWGNPPCGVTVKRELYTVKKHVTSTLLWSPELHPWCVHDYDMTLFPNGCLVMIEIPAK